MRKSLPKPWGVVVLLAVLSSGRLAAQMRKSVWDGVFTAQQAARGRAMFAATCAACHGADLNGVNRPPLKGEVFLNHWMEGGLDALFSYVKSMPPNRADLGGRAYVDLLAFLLEANGFPAGTQELSLEAIPAIRVQGKNGPAPVPNFALVDVVGCFGRGTNDAWILTNGTEPSRTRNPGQPAESEIAIARAKQPGTQTFHLLDVRYFSSTFHPEAHVGQKVLAKGFLIRQDTGARLNVTWIEMLAAECGQF
jgi:hypothetical protein